MIFESVVTELMHNFTVLKHISFCPISVKKGAAFQQWNIPRFCFWTAYSITSRLHTHTAYQMLIILYL